MEEVTNGALATSKQGALFGHLSEPDPVILW